MFWAMRHPSSSILTWPANIPDYRVYAVYGMMHNNQHLEENNTLNQMSRLFISQGSVIKLSDVMGNSQSQLRFILMQHAFGL